jgi:hypothetical protein
MSTILKALRRLEEERSARSARALRDDVVAPGRAAPARTVAARRSRRAWLQGAAAGLALAAIAWAFWPRAEAPPAAPAASAPPPVASAPPAPAAFAPLPPVAAPSLQSVAPEAPQPEPLDAPAAAVAPSPATPPAPARIAVSRAAAESERERMRAAERRRVEDAAAAAPAPAAEEEPVVVRPRSGPEITVARTIWHPAPERRVAVVEPPGGARREVHEGDTVDDYRVVRIEPSGVVFERDGVERLRKIGEAR